MKTLLYVAAIVLVAIATEICLMFGTIGWAFTGFGVLTDCTDSYSGSASGSGSCATTEFWLNAGGLAQQLLAATGVGLLLRGLRTRQSGRLAGGGAALIVSSVLIVAGTTWLAEHSYCQPGTAGYRSSYCTPGD